MNDAGGFTRAVLQRNGFAGFVSVRALRDGRRSEISTGTGVYVVLRQSTDPPEFLELSPAGWYKNSDPAVPVATLWANWVEGVPTLYIGKAENLRRRIRQLIDFGADRRVAHRGGRYLWQVVGSDEFVVACRENANPREAEQRLIREFRAIYGKRPFANLTD